MQIALVSSAKSLINNTYTRKVIYEWFEVLKCCICWPSNSFVETFFVEIFLLYQLNDLFGIWLKMYMKFNIEKS